MRCIAVEDALDLKLRDLLEMVREEDALILTEDGEGRYVLGEVGDLDAEAVSLSGNPDFMAYLDRCRSRAEEEGSASLADARRLLAADTPPA